MTDRAYKIAKLKELERLKKKALEAPESVTTARFEGEATACIPKDDEKPAVALSNRNDRNPMPASLRGMSQMDIKLALIDGSLDLSEQNWLNKKRGPAIDFSHYGAWML